jgi:hypothetical protein
LTNIHPENMSHNSYEAYFEISKSLISRPLNSLVESQTDYVDGPDDACRLISAARVGLGHISSNGTHYVRAVTTVRSKFFPRIVAERTFLRVRTFLAENGYKPHRIKKIQD